MNNSKFIENIWITFSYNSIFCIGRTKISDGIEMVALVTETGELECVLYEKIIDVKQLKLLKDVKFNHQQSIKKDMEFDLHSN